MVAINASRMPYKEGGLAAPSGYAGTIPLCLVGSLLFQFTGFA